MTRFMRAWAHLEEGLVAFLLALMTLVTFTYVMVNNLYTVFYDAADLMPFAATPLFAIGDFIIDLAQRMTWSIAVTKACFAWLIFIGIAYIVRIGANIGVDLLVRLLPVSLQRVVGIVTCLICIAYTSLFTVSSYTWVQALMRAGIGAEDLDQYGILQWHITAIVPIGFTLVLIRLIEVLIRMLRGQQVTMELSNESTDALKLQEEAGDEEKPT
ncbi:TRAP transporter small permease [Salinicola peritrichatus]|uniref:TRAP transporter small permease n=1 Tax=Salinicola peritrichatus TaxID=1267424 RepID=UPI000DA11FB7|nr:TRAP transporter small permease [Salinicola peritrichatus]